MKKCTLVQSCKYIVIHVLVIKNSRERNNIYLSNLDICMIIFVCVFFSLLLLVRNLFSGRRDSGLDKTDEVSDRYISEVLGKARGGEEYVA